MMSSRINEQFKDLHSRNNPTPIPKLIPTKSGRLTNCSSILNTEAIGPVSATNKINETENKALR